jgi:hypothetical protein
MKNTIISSLLILILYSCNQREENTKSIVQEFFKDPQRVYELEQNAIVDGDRIAYDEVFSKYLMDARASEILYISMVMANKWNYPKAYYDTYCILSTECLGSTISKINDKNRELAIFFLLRSSELGYATANLDIQTIFGKINTKPKSKDYLIRFSL